MKMNKKLFSILFAITLILFIYQNVYAQSYEYKNLDTNYSLWIEDDASLLSETDIDRLVSDMMPLTEYGNIGFKSITDNNISTEKFAHDHYFNKYGTANGSLFLVDMYNRMIYIYSDGENFKIITKSKADIITDNIYTYASKGDYYLCASKAYSQMNTLFAGDKIMEPMRYISNALIAVVGGFLINFIIVLVNSKIKSAKAEEILKNCKIRFQINNITAQKTGEHRVYSPQSDSGGYSSGGHSSGGGGHSSYSSHSSGGGGGHRF